MMLDRRYFLAGAVFSGLVPGMSVAAKVRAIVSIRDFGARPGTNVLPAVNAALAYLRETGGGVLIFPENGGKGWVVDGCVYVNASNIHIGLSEDVYQISDSPSSLFLFSGSSRDAPLHNVSIFSVGSKYIKIDGNGRRYKKYKYITSDTIYSCVVFRWCDHWSASGVYGFNGLVNCLRSYQCGAGGFFRCDASHSVYDNGLSIDLNRVRDLSKRGVDVQRIKMSRAWACAGFGATAYASTNVIMEDIKVWMCGNDDPSAPVSGGGISIEGDYRDKRTASIDRNIVVKGADVRKCWNSGFFITAKGVNIYSPYVEGTKIAVRRSNFLGEKGSNVYCIAAACAKIFNGKIVNSEGSSVVLVNDKGYIPILYFDGSIIGSSVKDIYIRKFGKIYTSKRATIYI